MLAQLITLIQLTGIFAGFLGAYMLFLEWLMPTHANDIPEFHVSSKK